MKELLIKLNACDEAIEWAAYKTWEEVYNTCHRGDWLLWLFKKTNPDDLRLLTLAKGHCANTVRHLMKDERSINAVDAAIAFGEGKINIEELNGAAYAAYAAVHSDASSAVAATYAAVAATYAATSDFSASASAATYAATSATAAAADAYYSTYADDYDAADASATYAAAKKENQKQTADICRKYLPIDIWNINL